MCPTDGTPCPLRMNSMYGPGGARSGTAGALTCSELPPDELNSSGMRSSVDAEDRHAGELGPLLRGRIPELGGKHCLGLVVETRATGAAGDQHLAIGQHGPREVPARVFHRSRETPGGEASFRLITSAVSVG